MRYLRVLAVMAVVLFGFGSAPVMSDTYPSRVVTIVVPYPAGGSVDGVARMIAQKLTESLGQSFIVENRAGGVGGIVGASYVARANPDGYTLMLTASIHVVTPFLRKTMPYDVVADFTPITLVASGPLLVSTTPTVPANTARLRFAFTAQHPDAEIERLADAIRPYMSPA